MFVANLVVPGRYIINTLFDVRDIMYSPKEIEAILEDRGLAYETLSLEQIEARGGGGLVFSRPEVGLCRL
jgi:hypothetical protein